METENPITVDESVSSWFCVDALVPELQTVSLF